MRNLAEIYRETSAMEKARPVVVELLAAWKARAETAGAHAKNAYAWELLTCEPADLQDPEQALRFALRANELTEFKNVDFLDTLARSYYRIGRTAEAIDLQQKALAQVSEDDGVKRRQIEQALDEFRSALRRGGEEGG